MELADWQVQLTALLIERGVAREDVFSVMLVLTKEEKGKKMLAFLRENSAVTPDEICRQAGLIAFGEDEKNFEKNR